MEFWVVDHLEEDYAVCESEDRKMTDIPLEKLPHGVKEGDVIRLVDGIYRIDLEETQRRREENRKLLESLLDEASGRILTE